MENTKGPITIGTSAMNGGERRVYEIAAREILTSMLRVAAYARVSSDSADQLNSYISQVKHYTDVITENEQWEFVDVYADEGLTGTAADKREDFQRMLADCRKGKIDRILVKSVSRFARNTTDCIRTIHELRKLGVSVLFEKENIDTAKMSSEVFLSMYGMNAQRESMSISGNMKSGVRMKMRNGTFVSSSTPYGYILQDNELVVQEEQAAVVRQIFDSYLSGMGVEAIARMLNEQGAVKRDDTRLWHKTGISYILTNISYTGEMIWQKSFTTDTLPFRKIQNTGQLQSYHVEDSHQPIISKEAYENVQALMATRRAQFRIGGPQEEHLLAKKVLCGHCGKLHRRKVTSGKAYWVCRRRDANKANCPVPQVPETALLDACTRLYNKLQMNREYILGPVAEQLRQMAERRYRCNHKLQDVNKELAALAEQVLVLNRLKSKGYVEPALYFTQMDELNVKAGSLRVTKRRLLENNEDSVLESVDSLIGTLECGPERITTIDEDLFEDLVENILVDTPERIRIRLWGGLEFEETIEKR